MLQAHAVIEMLAGSLTAFAAHESHAVLPKAAL